MNHKHLFSLCTALLLLTSASHLCAQTPPATDSRRFTFGIEPVDAGLSLPKRVNPDYQYYVGRGVAYYNVGFSARLGNYLTPFQTELGIKPGLLIGNKLSYMSTDGENKVYFHMPIFIRLKYNIWKVDDDIRFYLSALGWYNVVRRKAYEDDFSAGGGIGVAFPHFEVSTYYKQDLQSNGLNNFNRSIGLSFGYYF
ncbi:MAG: hypothetical protein LBL78_00005 [Prevotellaceae bacterium]|jgi:hypothetical protein|nr:hypothetical protein [Prevotellaceae bacterium]